MDIEELKIENVIELFSMSDRMVNFKSMELTKIQCKQVLDFINQQQETIRELERQNKGFQDQYNKSGEIIDSLKCCGNCGAQDGYDCRACERNKDNDSTYKNVTVNDQWQPI